MTCRIMLSTMKSLIVIALAAMLTIVANTEALPTENIGICNSLGCTPVWE